MQIVIDIPDSNYKEICDNRSLWEIEPKHIYSAIANGTIFPEQKTGTWILDADREHGRCSECGCKEDLVDGHSSYKWCSNCGAKMEDQEE